jgi:hypothetical protein
MNAGSLVLIERHPSPMKLELRILHVSGMIDDDTVDRGHPGQDVARHEQLGALVVVGQSGEQSISRYLTALRHGGIVNVLAAHLPTAIHVTIHMGKEFFAFGQYGIRDVDREVVTGDG